MSVIVMADYQGEPFEAEVFHDGHIEFPERELQFEQAMEEFTNLDSAVVKLDRLWEESPTEVIFYNMELPKKSCVLLVADYAEHVIHIYEDRYPDDLRPRKAIEATRKFVAGRINSKTLGKAVRAAETAERAAYAAATGAAWAATESARAAAEAAKASESSAWELAVSLSAARAAAWNVSRDRDSSKQQQARDVEKAWQVRRFVDVMEAVGQDLPWPPMEATP
jgi:hypothetical protein